MNSTSYKQLFTIFQKNPNLSYFDHASSSLTPILVVDAIVKYYNTVGVNIHRADYPLAQQTYLAYQKLINKIKVLINANGQDTIFLTSGATESSNLIVNGLHQYLQKLSSINNPKMNIIIEYGIHISSMYPWINLCNQLNIDILFWKPNSKFIYEQNSFQKLISNKTAAVVVSSQSNGLGFIKNFATLHKKLFPSTLLIVDGAQGICHYEQQFTTWGVDAFYASFHKFFGPTGIGFTAISQKLQKIFQITKFGGSQITRFTNNLTPIFVNDNQKFEPGTQHVAGIYGGLAAIDFLQQISYQNIQKHEQQLKTYFYHHCHALETKYTIIKQQDVPFILLFSNKYPSQDIATYLGYHHICVRSGDLCCKFLPKMVNVPTIIRISLAIYNDENDIQKCIDRLAQEDNLLSIYE